MKCFRKTVISGLIVFLLLSIVLCANADQRSGDFQYSVLEDGTVEITKYTDDSSSVRFPSEIDGRTVTSVGDSAFEGCMLWS